MVNYLLLFDGVSCDAFYVVVHDEGVEKWGNSDYQRVALVIERESENSAGFFVCTPVR